MILNKFVINALPKSSVCGSEDICINIKLNILKANGHNYLRYENADIDIEMQLFWMYNNY